VVSSGFWRALSSSATRLVAGNWDDGEIHFFLLGTAYNHTQIELNHTPGTFIGKNQTKSLLEKKADKEGV
jgi:hypothetical protein